MTRHLSLAEFLWLGEQITGVPASTLAKGSRIDLADSALQAPEAGFGDEDFYPDPYDKAAVLACRLAWNHPLVDGNKRTAWACLVLFIDLNDGWWEPDPPDVDEAEAAQRRARFSSARRRPGSVSQAAPRPHWGSSQNLIVRWHADCQCWRSTGAFRPATGDSSTRRAHRVPSSALTRGKPPANGVCRVLHE